MNLNLRKYKLNYKVSFPRIKVVLFFLKPPSTFAIVLNNAETSFRLEPLKGLVLPLVDPREPHSVPTAA